MDDNAEQNANRKQRFTSKSARLSGGASNFSAERFSHSNKAGRQIPHQNFSPYLQSSVAAGLTSTPTHNMVVTGSVLPTSVIGDKVIITEHPHESGVLMMYRTEDDKMTNPDRLNLDRRGLRSCPKLGGEDQLRLLNYQHNYIQKIDNLSNLKRLLFLDLYNNEIQQITGLSALRSLRVLMLGKNRIRKIEGLDNLHSLDVLDLHANLISEIEGLSQLTDLRVLNLAGNQITRVTNLQGLQSLTELNLRRNKIRRVEQIDQLPELKRLFLSFNEIANFDEISNLCASKSLHELTMDANPLNLIPQYRSVLIRKLKTLQQLDMKPVTEEERRMIFYLFKREDETLQRKKEPNKLEALHEKHASRKAQDSSRTRSAPLRVGLPSSLRPRTPSEDEEEEQQQQQEDRTLPSKSSSRANSAVSARHVTTVPNMPLPIATVAVTASYDRKDRPPSGQKQVARVNAMPRAQVASNVADSDDRSESLSNLTSAERTLEIGSSVSSRSQILSESPIRVNTLERELSLSSFSTGDEQQGHVIELDGEWLCLCGPASLNALERVSIVPLSAASAAQGGASTTSLNPSTVHCIYFLFIRFEQVVQSLHRVRARLPAIRAYKFRGNGISSLNQLNALANVHRLESLEIDNSDNGNPLVSSCRFWREFAIFRLGHLGLRQLNGQAVEASQVRRAEALFSGLVIKQECGGERCDQEAQAQDGAMACRSGRDADLQGKAASAYRQTLSALYAETIGAQERKCACSRCWEQLLKVHVSRQLSAIEAVGLVRFEREQYEQFIRRELANK